MGEPQKRAHAPPGNYTLHLCVLNPYNSDSCPLQFVLHQDLCNLFCIKNMGTWNGKENWGTDRMAFKANKVKAGMAITPHSVTVPLYGGQIHVTRDVSELNNRARKVFSRRGKAQIPTCLFLPHRGERCLGNRDSSSSPPSFLLLKHFSNSKQILCKENFIRTNTFWPYRIHSWQMHKYRTGEWGGGVQVTVRQVWDFTSELPQPTISGHCFSFKISHNTDSQ